MQKVTGEFIGCSYVCMYVLFLCLLIQACVVPMCDGEEEEEEEEEEGRGTVIPRTLVETDLES